MRTVIKCVAAASAIVAASLTAPVLAFPWTLPQVNGQGTATWQSDSVRESMGQTVSVWTRQNCGTSCDNFQQQSQEQFMERTTGTGQGVVTFTVSGPLRLDNFGGFGGFGGSFFR